MSASKDTTASKNADAPIIPNANPDIAATPQCIGASKTPQPAMPAHAQRWNIITAAHASIMVQAGKCAGAPNLLTAKTDTPAIPVQTDAKPNALLPHAK